MKLKKEKNSKRPISSIVLYCVATLIALIAIAFLVNNVLLFKNVLDQYVAQGYPSDEVIKQLVPSQLLPGIFEPIAVYGGISFILFGIGIINQKISECLGKLPKDENASEIDTTEQVVAVEETGNKLTIETE
ncbi:hypothetical protein [Desulfitobacterium sp.]|uniref:hypothetical protein n=1 Tax=Desulfitobacterium sp. TaxID=49981 RepID=UPI002B21E947|nr:hypothetical protein [Desulfitobacterium sp.]MEA4900923.1 hypothetical protein [Desulfitobacterium sp.]